MRQLERVQAIAAGDSRTGEAQIDARQFSYCSAFYPARISRPGAAPHEHFIVFTPDRRRAQERAEEYAAHRWGKPATVRVYPRTYVREARACYAAGDYA